MNDFSKSVRTNPVQRKMSKPSPVLDRGHEIGVDPSEIGIDDEYSIDPSEDEHGFDGSLVDHKEIGIYHHRYSYDHSECDHGGYDSSCGNPHNAG